MTAILHQIAHVIADNAGWSVLILIAAISFFSLIGAIWTDRVSKRVNAERDSIHDTGSPDQWRNYM